jgi:hypothetical protein
MMDQLNALKLFLPKMPTHIRDIVNPRDFTDLPALTERCYEIGRTEARILAPLQDDPAAALPLARSTLLTPPQPANVPVSTTAMSFQPAKKYAQQFLFLVSFRPIAVHPSCCMPPKNHPQIRTWWGPMAKAKLSQSGVSMSVSWDKSLSLIFF